MWQSEWFIYMLIWIMCLSGMMQLVMAMRGNIKSDQKNSVGLLLEVQPNPLGYDLSNSVDCVQEHRLCFLTHACMHTYTGTAAAQARGWFTNVPKTLMWLQAQSFLACFSLSCMNEDAATSCYIEVHGINKTKFSLIATTKVTHT